jgi:hypothetical protein
VRRSPEGALLVHEVRGDDFGWRLVTPGSDDCEFIDDHEMDPAWLEWPITWCPEAGFHEQDNIRRAQGAHR